MLQLNVATVETTATVSLAKPSFVSLRKRTPVLPAGAPVVSLKKATVSLAKPSHVSLRKRLPLLPADAPVVSLKKATVSLRKEPTVAQSRSEALTSFFGALDDLNDALGQSMEAENAPWSINAAIRRMRRSAKDASILAGIKLDADAAVRTAFRNRYINLGRWQFLDGVAYRNEAAIALAAA